MGGEFGRKWVKNKKTEYMVADFSGVPNDDMVRIGNERIKKVTEFKYLGEVMSYDGLLVGEIEQRIKSGWCKWREVTRVICD